MNVFNKLAAFKQALALAGVLSMTGTAMAKNGNSGVPGDLSADRTQVTIEAPDLPACGGETTATTTANVTAYLFQSVGRLINIGTYSGSVECTGSPTAAHDITIYAIPGLTFQPGPATLVFQYTTTTTTTDPSIPTPVTTQQTSYSGGRVNLHPVHP